MRTPNTPGALGYLLAVGVALACNALFVLADLMVTGGSWLTLPFALIEIGMIEAFLGAPIAGVGVLVLHLTCRRVRWQGVHVLVAAGLGYLAGACLVAWIGDSAGDSATWIASLPLYLGASAGLGRLAAVPVVVAQRRRFASRPPLRVP